jgi:hypothetical protein
MVMAPAKLLIVAYALAGAAAAGVEAATGSLVAAALTLWVGGAAVTLILPLIPGLRRGFRKDESGYDAARAEIRVALDRLETDRRADTARRRRRATG